MRDRLGLRSVFGEALSLVGLGGPLVLAGCEMTPNSFEHHRPELRKDPEFVKVSCAEGDVLLLDGLNAAAPFDYAVRLAPDSVQALIGPVPARLVESTGEPCATASARDACFMKLDAPRNVNEMAGQSVVLRITRGDTVIQFRDIAALLNELGAIDTPEEALLVAQMAGYDVQCGISGSVSEAGAFKLQLSRFENCNTTRRIVRVDAAGRIVELDRETAYYECEPSTNPAPSVTIGRCPQGLQARRVPYTRGALAAYFERAAELEAASVPAFFTLARELAAHGAPQALRAAALEAARDEARHARVTAALARRFGGCPRPRVVAPQRVRALEDMALENMVEGCVSESYGALVAHHQHQSAGDSHVTAAYAGIAEDETRHAELAWRVAAWADGKLGHAARRRVSAARRAAVERLCRDARFPVSGELAHSAGVPCTEAATAMLQRLQQSLWA